MKLTILYFGRIGEELGTSQESIEVSGVSTVREVISTLRKNHAVLEKFSDDYFRIARNAKYAQPSDAVSDSDTIALIPPVSGG